MAMSLTAKAIFGIIALFLAGCSHTVTDVPGATHSEVQGEIRHQLGDLAEKQLDALQRLSRAAGPMMIKNAALCPRRAMSLGFTTISDFDLPHDVQSVAYERLQLGRDAQVLNVIAGTQAWDAGIRTGDTLVMLNDKRVRNAADMRARMRKLDGERDVTLGFIRNGRVFEARIKPVPICNYRLLYQWQDQSDPHDSLILNAYATGTSIIITRGMMDFVTDEELQIVIGHELAHNIMHHGRKGKDNLGVILGTGAIIDVMTGFVGLGDTVMTLLDYWETKKWSPVFEKEADYVGLYLLARAGGNIDHAVATERRLGVALGSAAIKYDNVLFAHTHPMSSERAAIQARTVAEIKDKQSKGQELMPNLRKPWVYGQKYSRWDADDEDEWIDDDLNH